MAERSGIRTLADGYPPTHFLRRAPSTTRPSLRVASSRGRSRAAHLYSSGPDGKGRAPLRLARAVAHLVRPAGPCQKGDGSTGVTPGGQKRIDAAPSPVDRHLASGPGADPHHRRRHQVAWRQRLRLDADRRALDCSSMRRASRASSPSSTSRFFDVVLKPAADFILGLAGLGGLRRAGDRPRDHGPLPPQPPLRPPGPVLAPMFTRAAFETYCSSLPAVTFHEQWGGVVGKVGGKVFVLFGLEGPPVIIFKVTEMSFEGLTTHRGHRPARLLRQGQLGRGREAREASGQGPPRLHRDARTSSSRRGSRKSSAPSSGYSGSTAYTFSGAPGSDWSTSQPGRAPPDRAPRTTPDRCPARPASPPSPDRSRQPDPALGEHVPHVSSGSLKKRKHSAAR